MTRTLRFFNRARQCEMKWDNRLQEYLAMRRIHSISQSSNALQKFHISMPKCRSMTGTDGYIYAAKLQNANNIKDYDKKINEFKRRYNERVGTINIQLDLLVNTMEQNEARLYPLELLSDFSRQCVRKQFSYLPTIATTKSAIESCKSAAINDLKNLLSYPLNTRNTLENYYTNIFEENLANCDTKFNIFALNHTLCITNLTASANSHTVSSQKTFALQMDAAECSASRNIKRALHCSFGVFNRTIAQISETNIFINNCLATKSESNCETCDQMHTCSNIYYLNRRDVHYTNSTMPNPFYGLESILYFALLMAKGEEATLDNRSYNNGSLLLNETYVKTLAQYDMQMEMLKQPFNASLAVINMQLDMLIQNVMAMEQFMNIFQTLNGINKVCVKKYNSSLPTLAATKSSMGSCILTATSELNQIMKAPLTTRNYLQGNYTYIFEKQMENCLHTYGTINNSNLNYIRCLKQVNNAAESYMANNRRTFNTQMVIAQSAADKSIQKAVSCSFQAQSNTTTILSQVNTLINVCVTGLDCTRCSSGFSCPNIAYLPDYEVDYTSSSTTKQPPTNRSAKQNMYKLVAVLLFVLVISKAQGQGIGVYYNSSVLHTDTYINLNRQQHEMNLRTMIPDKYFQTNLCC
ncbi:hypothetical protein DOY81_001484 [Sarcophaga bullata]|nr:hypothetical protein DOY81_001484 [Sarcophaga bullata]